MQGDGVISMYIQRLLARRIVRYALVGGIGIPVNLLALALFRHLFGLHLSALAVVLSFEVSTTVNFVLNQTFTYSEQRHLRGWDWPRRALKAQLTSSSALLVSIAISLALNDGLGVNAYVAQALGIILAFFYNFAISNRLVFRPAPATSKADPAR